MAYKHLSFTKESLFLVTGGAGFIGSNLCEAILKMGLRVRCLDDLSTGKQKNVDLFIDHPNYEFVKGDIKDFDTCMKACEGVDFVLNQAAWGSVPRSIEMPLFYCANNIQGTLNMLEAARRNGVLLSMATNPTSPSEKVWKETCSRRMQSQKCVTRSGPSSTPSTTDSIPMACVTSMSSAEGRTRMVHTLLSFPSSSNY